MNGSPSARRLLLVPILCAVCLLGSSCGKSGASLPCRIPDHELAEILRDISDCVAQGPRFSGSPGAEKTAEWIRDRIAAAGRSAEPDVFTDRTPLGPAVFRNVILDVPGRSDRFLVIGAHYDTKYFPPDVAFQGANDGASGVAALLAVIRSLKGRTPELGLRFIFFDGEEARFSYGPSDGLHGSRHAVEKLRQTGELSRCRAMILLDMVGDRELRLSLPSDTPPFLAAAARTAAARLGKDGLVGISDTAMVDDHVPFRTAGIPSIDLIDFHYGPGNGYWHTSEDSLDKISAESIRTAGELVLEMIRILEEEP